MNETDMSERPQDESIELLRRITNAVEIMDPRGGRTVDSDYLWSMVAPITPGWPEANGVDWTLQAGSSYYFAEDPANLVPINLPNNQKLPYAMIQGGGRSVELIDDVTGLPVLMAGPGQVVCGCVGESSSFRAIVGPGVFADRIAVRFSARPLMIPVTGQTSGPVRILPPMYDFGVGGTLQAYGWFRNPTGARAIMLYADGVSTDASTIIGLTIFGWPTRPGSVATDGSAMLIITPGASAFQTRRMMPGSNTVGGSMNVNPLGKRFGFFIQVSPGTAALSQFNLSYELIY